MKAPYFKMSVAAATLLAFAVSGCALETGQSSPGPVTRQPAPAPSRQPSASSRPVDAAQAQRLQTIMVPLLKAMNHPIPLNQVKVGIMDDPHINAANAGGGEFYVTTGLLQKADDNHLRAVLAHETAHADLGHVTKLQTLSTGLNVGMILLDQIIPGSRAISPILGELVARGYTRNEEYQADAHGVEILNRAGFSGKALMVDTLTWLQQTEGASGGGFFATHPATPDRIQAVQKLR